jgi:long-chain-fatty-acid--[acyl-carrier-protein] ligase
MTYLLTCLVKALLWLRYRVVIRGRREVASRGRSGILFLPNHPALVDPIILMAALRGLFAPRGLADRASIDRFFIRMLARRAGVVGIPDIGKQGAAGAAAVVGAMDEVVASLGRGENFLLYPAGHLCRTRFEDLGANSAVETILRRLPEVRVVLVRTRGLWGSVFSNASAPSTVAQAVKGAFWRVPASLLFFVPRRRVEIELHEPADLPRQADRATINRYLERFYNEGAPPALYVPYTLWERLRRGSSRVLPEPPAVPSGEKLHRVPPATREVVTRRLLELSGAKELRDEDRLANDLGLDSLSRAELAAWLEGEFGYPAPAPECLQTAADVLLAACGEALRAIDAPIQPPGKKWFEEGWETGASGAMPLPVCGEGHVPVPHAHPSPRDKLQTACEHGTRRVILDSVLGPRISIPSVATIPEAFLEQARRNPDRALFADRISGVRTFREVVLACTLLAAKFRELPGEYLGIMLPASVTAGAAYLSALFAGKTPVMVNWTLGERNLKHAMDLLGVRAIVTAGPLVARIEAGGTSLAALRDRLVYIEDVRKGLSFWRKLSAAVAVRLSRRWGPLAKAKVSPIAAVLFTSGSESLPKAVRLTHANILANLRDVLAAVHIGRSDRLLGLLPPFHSFGLTVTMALPACGGLPVVYHPNPTDASALAGIIAAYRATLLVGTPTFLGGIARVAGAGELASLRLAVTGAEQCPPRVYEMLAQRCPAAKVLEGYGVTECSPIISVNDADDPRPGTIGKLLPSLECALVDEEKGRRVEAGDAPTALRKAGMLLVRGPSVFGGYLKYDGPSPFAQFEGKSWYRTGDLVEQGADGVLRFVGRLKRFVKIGGEMISLPAIEAALERHFPPIEPDPGKPPQPVFAVEAGGDAEHPEIVLLAAGPIDRDEANRHLRQEGLSPLHNIRRVVRVERIPLLGTGKTDYRVLKELVANS